MLAQHYLLLHTLPMAAQTFGASAVILSPILNLFIVAAALLLFLSLIQNNFIRNMFAGVGFVSILNSLFSNDNSRGSRFYTHPATFYQPRGHEVHGHPSTSRLRQNGFYPIHEHPTNNYGNPRSSFHGHS